MSHGVYVHVPWCRIRCPYCAFYVVPGDPTPQAEAYVDRVLAEARQRGVDFQSPRETVYIGGGTPSRLPIVALSRLLAGLVTADTAEVTVEANPEDLSQAWLDAVLEAGATRISLGVQTLSVPHARRLGRTHTPPEAVEAMERLHGSGVWSWTADLMFGLPGQTVAALEADLDALLAHTPPHVSLYGLTIEPGTPYERGQHKVALRPADEDTWREMYDLLVDRLGAAGLPRYEVSNFARPGHRSRHNAGYWEDRPYMGLGPAAHGYTPEGRRYSNHGDLDTWLTADDPSEHDDLPTPVEQATDLLISGLRGTDGVSLQRLAERTGHLPGEESRARLVHRGVLTETGGRMALTDEGFPVADAVVLALVDALAPVSGDAGMQEVGCPTVDPGT